MNIQVFAFINDILQSTIVIFGASTVLYNLGYSLRDRVTRAFTALVTFVVLVYMTELLVTNTAADTYASQWLRVTWIGIACVPAALQHLADALRVITGNPSRLRRHFVHILYAISLGFAGLVFFTETIFNSVAFTDETAHLIFVADNTAIGSSQLALSQWLLAGFAVYYAGLTCVSLWQVWQARQDAVIPSTKRRLNYILVCMVGAPLGVYPYLTHFSEITGIQGVEQATPFWLILIAGNLFVAFMLGVLTTQVVYFAATSSTQRVVRVRLYKFFARVPLAVSIVLSAYFFVINTSRFLGLEPETAGAFAVVAVMIIVGWAIHTFKRPLERLFQLNDDPDVRLLQQLSERIVTTRELSEYLETVLAITCNVLQTPSGFIVAYTAEGAKLQASVGLNEPIANGLENDSLQQLMQAQKANGEFDPDPNVELPDKSLFWQNYLIQPLRSADKQTLVGIVGVYMSPPESGELLMTDSAKEMFANLSVQAAMALEDGLLQQQVFSAVKGLLPQITALQQKRSAATFSGAPALTAEPGAAVLEDPDFSSMVRDALRDYWGGDKLTQSPLLELKVVQDALSRNEGNAINALREVLERAIERQKPDGDRSWTTPPWILYNILELKFVKGYKVRDAARRLAMSESDFYRKQRVAIENVAQSISEMERSQLNADVGEPDA